MIFFGVLGAPVAATSVSFTGSATDSDTSVAGVAIGAADAGRRVIVTIGYIGTASSSAPSISSVTIGGVAATVHAQSSNRNATTTDMVGQAIASAVVPSGTTATVSWSVDTGVTQSSVVGAWRVIGAPSASPHSTASDDANFSTKPAAGALNVPSGGFVILAASMFDSGGAATITLSPSSTQVIDVSSGDQKAKASWQSGLSADASYAVSADWDAGANGMAMAAVAWDM